MTANHSFVLLIGFTTMIQSEIRSAYRRTVRDGVKVTIMGTR